MTTQTYDETREHKRVFFERMASKAPEHLRERLTNVFEEELQKSDEQRSAEEEALAEKERSASLQAYKDRQREFCGLRGDQWFNSFSAYKTNNNPTRLEAKRRAIAFATDFPDVKKGLSFYGGPGRGKDHLLHAIVSKVIEKCEVYDIRYFYSLDIKAQMQAEWQRHDDPETAIEERMRECDLLLIGDLHRILSRGSNWVNERVYEAMTRVINQAESTGRPILCISGNARFEDYALPQFGGNGVESPLQSRLADCCDWLEICGEDMRRT